MNKTMLFFLIWKTCVQILILIDTTLQLGFMFAPIYHNIYCQIELEEWTFASLMRCLWN